jgi:hypothetical protein
MASDEKSFENLLKEAPAEPVAGTVSLVGMLAQSCEAGKFVLTLQDGNAVTLETASVKCHAVLGTSVGQTIVRVDVEAGKLPATAFGPAGTSFTRSLGDFPFWAGAKLVADLALNIPKPLRDPWVVIPPVLGVPEPGFAPFAMATPHQAPAYTLANVQGLGNAARPYFTHPAWLDPHPPKIIFEHHPPLF